MSSWQQWLAPRPRHRTVNTAEKTFYSYGKAAFYEKVSRPDGNWAMRETHYIDNPIVKAGLSGPPLHIHLLQDEYFQVENGVLGVIKDGVEYSITKEDPVVIIPAGTRHRFWCHKSSTDNLVFTAWADPCKDVENIFDVNFLRNHLGYLADCEKAGLKPSPFQLILYVWNSSSLMSPPFLNWMPIWMIIGVHIVLAWFAEYVLGYQRCYPEYTIPVPVKRSS